MSSIDQLCDFSPVAPLSFMNRLRIKGMPKVHTSRGQLCDDSRTVRPVIPVPDKRHNNRPEAAALGEVLKVLRAHHVQNRPVSDPLRRHVHKID